MGNSQSNPVLQWFCFCSPDGTESTFDLGRISNNTGSGESIESDNFDETTQVIVHDTTTNRNYVKSKQHVEDNPLRYIRCPLPERSNEVAVEFSLPGISRPGQITRLNFEELGLKTKRQQGRIPIIYLTCSQLPPAAQSSGGAHIFRNISNVSSHTSTRSSSSPSRRRRRSQRTSSSSPAPNRSSPATPWIMGQPRPRPSIHPLQSKPDHQVQCGSTPPISQLQQRLDGQPSSSSTGGTTNQAVSSQSVQAPAYTPPILKPPTPNG